MSVPKWVIKAIDKIRRAFLWKGRKEINGGSCLVAWEKVARHINLGGLGIPNLHVWSWALQMRCLWFQKTIPSKPWVGLEIPEHFNSKNLFANALLSQVGNGSNTLFWLDHWLHGKSLVDLAPDVVACVPNSLVLKRSMAECLVNNNWVNDIRGALPLVGIMLYLLLWDALDVVALSQEPDHISGIWKLMVPSPLSPATELSSWVQFLLSHGGGFGSLGPPRNAMSFCGWRSETSAGLQTAWLCDQEEETTQHILTTCVFARDFWHQWLAPLGLGGVIPSANEVCFADWGSTASQQVEKSKRKGFNSLVILGA